MLTKNGKAIAVVASLAAVVAVALGLAPAALLQIGLIALCPLMMLFMHGGHRGHGNSEADAKPAGSSEVHDDARHQH